MFAGLWELAGDARATATIITQPAVTTLQSIHPRMPTFLAPGCWEPWMDPELTGRERIRETARPLPSDALVTYPVSKRVNRPMNDDAALIEPEGGVGQDPAP